MSDLLAHIKAENAAAKAKGEKEGFIAGMVTEDLAHWHSYDIHTPEQYDKYMLATDIFEITRDVYNYKPHWGNLMDMSIADMEKELDNLIAASNIKADEDFAEQKLAIAEFEATVDNLIVTGAGDRKTAIDWLMDAEDVNGDNNFFEYCNNLPYGYLKGELMI